MTSTHVLERRRGDRRRPGSSSARYADRHRVLLVGAVATACALSVVVGARSIPLSAIWDSSHPLHNISQARIERTVLGLAVGAALALAGAVLQGLTRNPLADPGILGINAGASFAMVVGLSVFGVSQLGDFVWIAFVGAAVASVLVHVIASIGRDGATPMKLAIAGAALTAAASSWTTGVLLVDQKTMETFRYWQVGTVGGRGFDVLLVGAPFLVVGALLALTGARLLNTLALGDDLARGLGRRTAATGSCSASPSCSWPARDRAGRADRLRRARRAARRSAASSAPTTPACCRSRCSAARRSSSSPTPSAACAAARGGAGRRHGRGRRRTRLPLPHPTRTPGSGAL